MAALRGHRAAGRQDQGPGAAPGVRPQARRRPRHGGRAGAAGGRPPPAAPARPVGAAAAGRSRPPTTRSSLVEREALKLALQAPVLAGPMFDAVDADVYAPPGARRRSGGDRRGRRRRARRPAARSGSSAVRDACADLAAQALVVRAGGRAAARSTASPTRATSRHPGPAAAGRGSTSRIGDLKSKLQRVNPVTDKDEYLALLRRAALAGAARPGAASEQAAGGL